MVYWLGGSSGYGHIAVAVGNGKVRSTDAGGSGKVATVDIGWPESHWGLPYAGWADNVNDVTIPGVGSEDMPLNETDLQNIAHRVNQTMGDYNSKGQNRDAGNKNPEQGNLRLQQIENVVRDIQNRVKAIEKKL